LYENKKRDWARTRDLVFPEIRDDPQEYERRVKHGLRDAEAYLETRAQHELFTLETIQRTHELIFARVYEFAGEFRQPGQEPAVGQENWDAAFHSRVKPELERLRAFVDKALERGRGSRARSRRRSSYPSATRSSSASTLSMTGTGARGGRSLRRRCGPSSNRSHRQRWTALGTSRRSPARRTNPTSAP